MTCPLCESALAPAAVSLAFTGEPRGLKIRFYDLPGYLCGCCGMRVLDPTVREHFDALGLSGRTGWSLAIA